jgi:hypothetical protein
MVAHLMSAWLSIDPSTMIEAGSDGNTIAEG